MPKSANYGEINSDIPLKISGHTLHDDVKPESGKLQHLFFRVEWQKRSDDIQPKPSFYSYHALKEKVPMAILDYIETNLELYE